MLLVVGAVIVFINPGATFVSLAIVVGFYFVFAGTYDIVSSLFSVGTTPAWGLQLFAGIIQVLLGFLASSSLSNSVIVLVIYVSVSALFRGGRRDRRRLHGALAGHQVAARRIARKQPGRGTSSPWHCQTH
ncbi:MAG: DUF308 domain-containing protein [Galbitalea sp.]